MAGCDASVVVPSADGGCVATPSPRLARDEGSHWGGGGGDKTEVTGCLPLVDLAIPLVTGLAPVPGVLEAWASLLERSTGVCREGMQGAKEVLLGLGALSAVAA